MVGLGTLYNDTVQLYMLLKNILMTSPWACQQKEKTHCNWLRTWTSYRAFLLRSFVRRVRQTKLLCTCQLPPKVKPQLASWPEHALLLRERQDREGVRLRNREIKDRAVCLQCHARFTGGEREKILEGLQGGFEQYQRLPTGKSFSQRANPAGYCELRHS